MKNYIKSDGNVSRLEISMDIQYRNIGIEEIHKIDADPVIKKQYIGTVYKGKKPNSEWDETHLKSVSYDSDTEVFNLDYMLYLNKVAEYVAQIKDKTKAKKQKSKKILRIAIIGTITVIIIAVIAAVSKTSAANKIMPEVVEKRTEELQSD